MNNILFDETPIVVSRKLAQIIGLDEAVIVQQIHYWLQNNIKNNKNYKKGRYWAYSTTEKWLERDFPFFKTRTFHRLISNLKKKGIIISDQLSETKTDRTLWFTLNYEVLENLRQTLTQSILPNWQHPSCQNGNIHLAKLATSIPPNWQHLHEEIKEENKQETTSTKCDDVFSLLSDYGIAKNKSLEFAKKFNISYINYILKKVKSEFAKGKIKNLPAYIVKILNESTGVIPEADLQAEAKTIKAQKANKKRQDFEKYKKSIEEAIANEEILYLKKAEELFNLLQGDKLKKFIEFVSNHSLVHKMEYDKNGINSNMIKADILIFEGRDQFI